MSNAINAGWFNASLFAEIHGKDAAKFLKLPEVRAFITIISAYTDIKFEELVDRRGGDIILNSDIMYARFIIYLDARDAHELLEWLADELERVCSDAGIDHGDGTVSVKSIVEEYREIVAGLKRKGSVSGSL